MAGSQTHNGSTANGGVVLTHENQPNTVRRLDEIVSRLIAAGFEFRGLELRMFSVVTSIADATRGRIGPAARQTHEHPAGPSAPTLLPERRCHRLSPDRVSQSNLDQITPTLDQVFRALVGATADMRARKSGCFAAAPTEFRILSSLAEGSDRQMARTATRAGYALHTVLPFERGTYEKDFQTPESLSDYRELLECVGRYPRTSRRSDHRRPRLRNGRARVCCPFRPSCRALGRQCAPRSRRNRAYHRACIGARDPCHSRSAASDRAAACHMVRIRDLPRRPQQCR